MKKEIVKTMEEAKAINNSIIIDIDEGVALLQSFLEKTVAVQHIYKKLQIKLKNADQKYMNKKYMKFVEENLLKIFKTEFLNKFYKNKTFTQKEILGLRIYMLGTFVLGHSNKDSGVNKPKALANTIKEITDNIYTK